MLEELFPVILVLRTAGCGIAPFFTAWFGLLFGFRSRFAAFFLTATLASFLFSFSFLAAAFFAVLVALAVVLAGYFDDDLASAVQDYLVQGLDDHRSLGLDDFEEREVLHQVNTTHLYTFLLQVAVDKLDNLIGIEAVCFSEVQEEAGIAFLCFPAGFLLVSSPFLAFFRFAFLVAVLWLFNFRSVLVIFQEAVELHRYYTLDQVFLAQPFELAVDARQESFDFLFVHLYLFDFVNYLDELLFTDFLAAR